MSTGERRIKGMFSKAQTWSEESERISRGCALGGEISRAVHTCTSHSEKELRACIEAWLGEHELRAAALEKKWGRVMALERREALAQLRGRLLHAKGWDLDLMRRAIMLERLREEVHELELGAKRGQSVTQHRNAQAERARLGRERNENAVKEAWEKLSVHSRNCNSWATEMQKKLKLLSPSVSLSPDVIRKKCYEFGFRNPKKTRV